MKRQRIENAISIIRYAIRNQVSVKEASKLSGYSDTYVKNIKSDLKKAYKSGRMTKEVYDSFYGPYLEYCNTFVGSPSTTSPEGKVSEPNKPKDIPKSGGRESFRVKGYEAEYEWVGGANYPSDHVRTLDQLLAATQVNQEEWKTKDVLLNKWDVTSWKKGYAETKQNFQVKARLERNNEFIRERIVGELFQKMIKDYTPPVYYNPQPQVEREDNLLEISIFDLHIGKLAWGGETFENYDVKIARKRFLGSIEKLLQNASGFNYERILFPVGNDFFNSDTMENTTTKGTPQDEDLRWQKTFDVGTRLLVDGINMLKQSGVPVDVVVVPGNHDFERSYYMGSYLSAWFKDDPTVCINNHASPRKYYIYGNTMLGLTHGSEEKEASLPMLMATDVDSKPHWTSTKFHEWHLGHIHRKRTVKYEINKSRELNEDLGVTIRYLSSLTGTEEWHHKKGYVGSTKAADGFVWNKEFGLVAHLNTNLILD